MVSSRVVFTAASLCAFARVGACSSDSPSVAPSDDASASGVSASGSSGSAASDAGGTEAATGAAASGAGGATSEATAGSSGTGSGSLTGTSGAAGDSAGSGVGGAAGLSGSGESGTASDAGVGTDSAASGGDSSVAVAWACPTGFAGRVPTIANVAPARVPGVPPADADGRINGNGCGSSTLEGPVWSGSVLYMSEFAGSTPPPPSRILMLGPADVVSVVGAATWNSGTNGLAIDRSGTLFGAVHADGSISRMDPIAGTRTPVAARYNGARFNSPNDLAIRSDGTIYFSDPKGSQTPNPAPQSQERVYRVSAAGSVSVVDMGLPQPNGVSLSLDEKTLYVSSRISINGKAGAVFAYPVMPDGSTGARPSSPFATANIDGMVLDCAGNVYGAVIGGKAIEVFSPTGTVLGTIPVPSVEGVTNVAFGGVDHKTLYITALGTGGACTPPQGGNVQGLYRVTLDIPGLPY